jgi:hypothetical protein
VIEQIGDDLDDPRDVVEADCLSWANRPMLSRAEMLRVIEQSKKLDGRAVNLFRNALQRPRKSDLFMSARTTTSNEKSRCLTSTTIPFTSVIATGAI